MTRWHDTGLHSFLWQDCMRPAPIHFYDKPALDRYSSIFMTSQQKTGTHPFYIGMYIHIYTHIYVHIYIYFSEGMFTYFLRDKDRLALRPPLGPEHLANFQRRSSVLPWQDELDCNISWMWPTRATYKLI